MSPEELRRKDARELILGEKQGENLIRVFGSVSFEDTIQYVMDIEKRYDVPIDEEISTV